jgi:hypothetical protein
MTVRPRKEQEGETLTALRAELDHEMAVLRQPGAAEELRQLSNVTPEEIAEAANAAVARRKQ